MRLLNLDHIEPGSIDPDAGYYAPAWIESRFKGSAQKPMLTLHPASSSRRNGPSPLKGLAVAGGGPLGAIYELGALRALDESLDGLKLHELDVYVGVSAGAFVAASLANGISTSELCRIFMADDDADLQFHPERFLRPAYREYIKRGLRIP